MTDYKSAVKIFKALNEVMRLQILEMLSCKEMCACEILEGLAISQSTLSHHMKVLMECGLISGRKEATWMYYKIDENAVDNLHTLIDALTHGKENCLCYSKKSKCVSKKVSTKGG